MAVSGRGILVDSPFLPLLWIAASVHHGNHQYHVAVNFINDEIGKSSGQRLSSVLARL